MGLLGPRVRDGATIGLTLQFLFFFNYFIYIYIYTNLSNFFKKIISLILLRVMLYSQTFLQIILVSNSYWFAYGPNTHIIFLLASNYLSHQ